LLLLAVCLLAVRGLRLRLVADGLDPLACCLWRCTPGDEALLVERRSMQYMRFVARLYYNTDNTIDLLITRVLVVVMI